MDDVDVQTLRNRLIISYSGFLLMGMGLILLMPLLLIIVYPGEVIYAYSFIIPGLLALAGGFVLWRFFRVDPALAPLRRPQALILIGVFWVTACLFGATPFVIGFILSPLDGFFEAVSGWTTTGLTMVDVAMCPHIFLFWRSLMQFVGGAGFAVLMLTAIIGPKSGVASVYSAEARTERLLPAIRHTARMIIDIYLLYFFMGTILYYFAGMPLFDSTNHSMCALSTGGFSTQPGSIGAYQSLEIEIVTMVLMVLGSLSFAFHYLLLSGKLGKAVKDIELKVMYTSVIVFLPIVTYSLVYGFYHSPLQGFRHALFNVVSALTTTGYMTASGENMHHFGYLALFSLTVLMCIGGSTGSTAGGIKRYRVGLIAKSIFWEIKARLLPESAVIGRTTWYAGEKETITPDLFMEISIFTFAYALLYIAGVIVFLLSGYSVAGAMFEHASAMGTVGLSIGITGPSMPVSCKIMEIIGMILGRLELWAVLISIATPFEWIISRRG
ncbi:MAG: TrkH family potassium uptake protein [Methanosarcinales archaeon]|nr:MAG: TrkH family potassium uptake protein [Methanosarcinales archaeon]